MDGDRIIGRDRELAVVQAWVGAGEPGIVLIVGDTTKGKSALLRALREQLPRDSVLVLPSDDDVAAGGEPWLTVTKRTTVDDVREKVRQARVARDRAESGFGSAEGQELIVLLVYGYRPDESFRRWVEASALRTVLDERVLVIIAAPPADVRHLEPGSDLIIRLGPLATDAVLSELRALDARISDKLTEQETAAYAQAIADKPSLIGALSRLLPLTSGSAAGAVTTLASQGG